METRLLTLRELRELHRGILRRAFPPSELKPFRAMEQLMAAGRYEPLALGDGSGDVCWALCWHSPRCVLLDYFVTAEERRGQGLGAEMMERLRRRYLPQRPVVAETEAPEAENAGERELQRRRLNYYLRLGFQDAGFEVLLFGVHYRILVLGPREGIREAYLDLYREGTSSYFRAHYLKVLEAAQ